ncbi:hypothetical protein BC828DRAFT_383728, partial [Blastocladiella britannica]
MTEYAALSHASQRTIDQGTPTTVRSLRLDGAGSVGRFDGPARGLWHGAHPRQYPHRPTCSSRRAPLQAVAARASCNWVHLGMHRVVGAGKSPQGISRLPRRFASKTPLFRFPARARSCRATQTQPIGSSRKPCPAHGAAARHLCWRRSAQTLRRSRTWPRPYLAYASRAAMMDWTMTPIWAPQQYKPTRTEVIRTSKRAIVQSVERTARRANISKDISKKCMIRAFEEEKKMYIIL